MRLKKERQKARLTQSELSRLSGVSQSFISRLEGGQVRDASSGYLEDLAAVLRRRGAKVEGHQLAPHRTPALISGVFAQSRKRRRVA
jgi:transcriptional regulator with XRE-family HTH domain